MTMDAGTGQGTTGAGEGEGQGQGQGAGTGTTLLGGDGGQGQGQGQSQGSGQGSGQGQQQQGQQQEHVYEFKSSVEGMELEKEATAEFTQFAKDNKLEPAVAQKVVDIGARMVQRQIKAFTDEQTAWTTEVQKDAEFGGQHLEGNIKLTTAVLDKFGSPELKTWLKSSGAGNNPHLFRAMVKMAKAMSPDTLEMGERRPGNGDVDPAKVMFPNMN